MTHITAEPHPMFPTLTVLTHSDGRRALVASDMEVVYPRGEAMISYEGGRPYDIAWNYLGDIDGRLVFGDHAPYLAMLAENKLVAASYAGLADWARRMLPDVVRNAVVTDSLRAGLGLPLDENPCIVRSVN